MLRLIVRVFSSLFTVLCAALLVSGAWLLLQEPVEAPDWNGHFAGLTYSGYRSDQGPAQRRYPSEAQVREDLKLLAPVTRRIRTYSTTEGPDVAGIAEDQGIEVMAGSWIEGIPQKDTAELVGLVRLANAHANVKRLLVGNETLLRGDFTVAGLSAKIDAVRRKTRVPVSTTEPWGVWLANPELAKHVDFIGIHVLPYWEYESIDHAVDEALARIAEVKAAFPGKQIVIAETGWPSHGDVHDAAVASRKNQNRYLREFAHRAAGLGLDYYVIEAFDEQWKLDEEGRPGAYWGVFDAQRRLKLQATGTLYNDPLWPEHARWALLAAALPALLFCLMFGHLRWVARMAFCTALFALSAFLSWYGNAFAHFYAVLRVDALEPALIAVSAFCMLVLLVQLFEAMEVLGVRRWRREFVARLRAPAAEEPFVSIHVACANEPPAMVIDTLESLQRLAWTRYEVVVVDNNTTVEALWRPVEAWVAAHPEHFRFHHVPHCPGFKAEALNFALAHSDPRTEVVGVVDADYVVEPDWLNQLTGHFDDPDVALVQAPQAHRAYERSRVERMANWEFDGFFRIGMHHRNERDAIIQHGTMALIRADALRRVGGWAHWTLCEDAELGLRLMEHGYSAHYVDRVFGCGLAPPTFAALKSQRRRWAVGAMQILKRHALQLLGPGKLTLAQRYHFICGWLPWLSEALQLLLVLACLTWTGFMLVDPKRFEPPVPAALGMLFALPVLRFCLGVLLYRLRVRCSWKDTFGAALASLALNHAIAMGVLAGLFGRGGKFIVTAKAQLAPVDGLAGRSARMQKAAIRPVLFAEVRQEAVLAALLITASVVSLFATGWKASEPRVWSAALMVLALPYLAALAMAFISAAIPGLKSVPRSDPAHEVPAEGLREGFGPSQRA